MIASLNLFFILDNLLFILEKVLGLFVQLFFIIVSEHLSAV
jgi:hypothetical protein